MTLDELKQHLKDHEKWQKTTILGSIDRAWDWIRFKILEPITEFPLEIVYGYERARRGYSSRDVWSLDWFLSSWMPQALKDIKSYKAGVPGPFTCDSKGNEIPFEEGQKKWEETLDKMILGWEANWKLANMLFNVDNKKEYKQLQKQADEGIKLFAKYLGCLWT